jgi:microsomal epoxide hydrolase
MSSNIEPEIFTIAVADEVLSDLRRRLSRVRWPDEIADTGWRYGTSLSYLRELIAYWEHAYDWRQQEGLLNSFDQYRVRLGDITLHYIHQPGIGPDPLPVIISHGWPGSIAEFVVIRPVTAVIRETLSLWWHPLCRDMAFPTRPINGVSTSRTLPICLHG